MKKLIILTSISIAFTILACSSTKTESASQTYKLDTTALKVGEEFYQCPMHPAVISDKPGDCPECGMALEKRTKN